MIKIAVITRTKDRPIFLQRAIKSIADQTFTNYVHVIVNDGGDSHPIDDIVSSQSSEVKAKIKVFHRSESSNGPDTIFNESIDRVKTEYVAILDDDDTWHTDFLLETTNALDANQSIAGVVVRTDKVIESLMGDYLQTIKTERLMPELQAVSLYRQFIDNQLMTNAFVFRRNAYEHIGKYDESLPVVADWEFGIRFLQKFDVEFLDPGYALAYYHHRSGVKDNSFSRHSDRKYLTMVANKYLRKDLENNVLGVGYIISDLRYRQDSRNNFIKRFVPNSVIKAIKRK